MADTKRKPQNNREPRAPKNAAPTRTPEDSEEMSQDLSKYVSTAQAAEMMGVVTEHINHLLKQGKIRGVKMGGRWLVYIPSLEKYAPSKSLGGRPRSGLIQKEESI